MRPVGIFGRVGFAVKRGWDVKMTSEASETEAYLHTSQAEPLGEAMMAV